MLDRWLMLGCMILELLLCIRLPYLCVCGKEYELYGWKRGIYFGVSFVMAVAVFCLLKPFYFTPISIVVEMTVVLVSVCFLTKEHRIFLSVLGLGILFGIRCLE